MKTILILCLSILFLPLTLAAETGFTVSGGTENTDYSYANNVYTVLTEAALTFSGSTTTDRIVIAEGVTADITLNDVSIDVSGIDNAGAIRLEKRAKLTLHLTGNESTLKSGNGAAGIGLSVGSDLHITAESTSSKLSVVGGGLLESGSYYSCYAGIGNNLSSERGKASVRISNGIISATGGSTPYFNVTPGTGIGQCVDNNIEIIIVFDGGKITVKTGSGYNRVGYDIYGDVTINNGTITDSSISGTKVTINNGTINNTNGSRILSKEITINGGNVTVTMPDGNFNNAIGDQDCNVTINGGTVAATAKAENSNGDPSGAGIAGTVTINGGHIIAIANGRNGAGIGGYGKYGGGSSSDVNDTKSSKPITITGGTVIASGGSVGIGSGPGVPTGLITITGGTITAKGTHWISTPVGIGSGRENPQTNAGIIITGGSIKSKFKDLLTDQNKATVYLCIISDMPNATDVSVDDIPYYISDNHPQEGQTVDNNLYLYMTGADHTIAVRTNDNNTTKVKTYTAKYVSGGVDSDGNNKGYFSFSDEKESTPSDKSLIAFEAGDITTTFNKESNQLTVKLTVTEPEVTTRSAAMNSMQLILKDETNTYILTIPTVKQLPVQGITNLLLIQKA